MVYRLSLDILYTFHLKSDPRRSRGQGKWETRSVFQGGEAPVFSTAFLAAVFPRKLLRRPIPQTAVRSFAVVRGPPSRDLPAGGPAFPEGLLWVPDPSRLLGRVGLSARF